ncbi:MAG: exopolysaccharide transport family protein [Acidobacteriota bacterium]
MNTTLKDILDIFFRHRRYVIIFSLIVASFTAIYVYGAKKVYTSKAQVLIRLGQEQMGSLQFMTGGRNVYVTRREQELKNEERIFLSDPVITVAATSILGDAASDPENLVAVKKYLSDHLEVKSLFESDTLSISFDFPNPFVAKKVLDILINKYIEHHIGVYENAKELSFIKLKLDESRVKYDQALVKYTNFTDSAKIYDEREISLLIEKRNDLRSDLGNVRAEYQYHLKKLNRSVEAQALLQPYERYNSIEVINDRRNKLKSKLNEAIMERQNMLLKYTPQSRIILDIEQEISSLQKLIKEEPERVINSVDSRKNETYWTIEQSIIDLRTTIAGEEGKIAAMEAELKGLEAELTRNSQNYQQFTMLKKDLDLAKTTYEKYYEGFLESDLRNINKNQQVTNISIIEEPSLNPLPQWPSKKKVMLLAGVFLVAGNLFLVIILSMMSNTVNNPLDVAKSFSATPLAALPLVYPENMDNDPLARKALTSIGAEDTARFDVGLDYYKKNLKEFQRMFINLTHLQGAGKVFLIARSLPGEGGTTITFNLAAFMANYLDKKVAFVDYYPSRLASAVHGATDVQAGQFSRAALSGVDYYRYKDRRDFKHEDVRDKYSILEQLKQEYDFVFCNIDSIKDSAALVFLNNSIDRVLFFIEADRTKSQVVGFNLDTLRQYGFANISFILNKRRFYIPKCLYRYV